MIAVRATMVWTALVAASVAAAQQPVPQPAGRQMDVMIVHGPGQAGAPAMLPPAAAGR